MAIIDSQVHVYEANTPKRPWHSVPNWPDHVTGDEMVVAMDKVGVDGAIFISAFSMYRYDASYAIEVQRAHPGRFALVKPVDPDDPAVADVIADWKKTPGTVGIRIMMTKEAGRAPNDPGLDRILRAAVRHDFPVNMLCWGNLDAGAALIDHHPDTRFIIDHLAIMQPRTPPAPPQPWADLPKVLDLAKRPNAVIKVSGACTLSREPYPFPDIWDPLARHVEDLRQIGERLSRRRRLERLLQAEMVDDDRRIRVPCCERCGLLEPSPAQNVHRQPMPRAGGQHAVDPRIGGIFGHVAIHHDADTDRARCRRPLGDRFGDRGVGGIHRLDEREAAGIFVSYLDRIARVVAVHREHRDEQSAIDPDGVHRPHHVVAGDLLGAGQRCGPRPAGMIPLVGVYLRIDRRHGVYPLISCAT